MGSSIPVRSTVPKTEVSMTAQLFQRIMQKFCRHRFSWPHTSVYGQDYQVCLSCGVAYEFDCSTMSRTGRLMEPQDLQAEASPARTNRASRVD